MPQPSTIRRYFIGCILAAAIFAGGSFALNTWVNPLWITPMPWSAESFGPYKPIHKHPRTGKAGLCLDGKWQVACVGSSRVDIAIDPLDPLWHGRRTCNLGLRGGNLHEFAALVEFAVTHNPKLEEVVLGIDHYDFNIHSAENPDFQQSPLTKSGDEVERMLRYYCGFSTTMDSFKSLNYRRKQRPASNTRFGQWKYQIDSRPFASIYKTDSLPTARRYLQARQQSLAPAPQKVAALDRILRACSDRKVRLTIALTANHATYMAAYFVGNDPDPAFDLNRAAVVNQVDHWNQSHPDSPSVRIIDFYGFHPLNCEPLSVKENRDWVDGTHALPSLGRLMIERIQQMNAGKLEPGYGVEVTPATLELRKKEILEGFEQYKQVHPEDWQWVNEMWRAKPVKNPAHRDL